MPGERVLSSAHSKRNGKVDGRVKLALRRRGNININAPRSLSILRLDCTPTFLILIPLAMLIKTLELELALVLLAVPMLISETSSPDPPLQMMTPRPQ